MAAVELTGYKDLSDNTLWHGDEQWVKANYDFATHGGTAAATTYSIAKLPAGYVVTNAFLKVNTAVEGTSSTLEGGVTGTTAGLYAQTAEATLVADYVLNFVGQQVVDSTNNTFFLTIGTADLTAGNVDCWIKVKKA